MANRKKKVIKKIPNHFKTEGQIQNEIIRALYDNGYRPKRMYLGPVIMKGGAQRKNPLKGFPDLFGWFLAGQGRMWVIEVKKDNKAAKTSEDQEKWIELLSGLGVFCLVARSADFALEKIMERDEFYRQWDLNHGENF